jgi:hypothetical protein
MKFSVVVLGGIIAGFAAFGLGALAFDRPSNLRRAF